MMNKKGYAQLVLLIGLLAGILTIGNYLGVLDFGSITGASSGYIERPVFYYDKCEQMSSLKYSATNTFYNSWLAKPSVTDEYSVSVSDILIGKTSTPLINLKSALVYSICNSQVESESNCRIYKKTWIISATTYTISGIKPEEYIHLDYQKAGTLKLSSATGKYQIGFIPYGIRQYNVLGGSANPINPNSCTYPSGYDVSDTIISEDLSGVSKPSGTTTDERTLQPGEIRWYVAGYVSSAEPSFKLTYKSRDAWCRPTGSSGEIYAINEVRTKGGTYKVASADYSDYLGSVNCCPGATKGDEVCSSSFKWESVGGSSCGAFNSCGSPNWVPFSPNTLIKYSCVSGTCQSQTKKVECASDYDCSDSNEICDLNNFECVRANVNLEGQVIETIPDNQQECEAKGGVWIKKTNEEKSFWNWVGIGEPEVIVTEYCNFGSGINWVKWIVVVLIIVAVFVFSPQIWALFRMLLSKIGVRI